jgi:enoyl-CoA hydratase/carnithine racemase
MFLRLGDTLNALRDDSEVRVVVLRGVGEQAFSSGFDVDRIFEESTAEDRKSGPDPMEYGLDCVADYPYPIIAMIYGYAVGAGLELAVTCDLRIASDTARLGITPAKLGVVYSPTGIQKFINLVGVAQTKELFYTGRVIDVWRAREIGLVDHVVPAAELPAFTYGLAREIAGNAPLSVRGAKAIIGRLLHYQRLSPEDQAQIEALRREAWRSQDVREGQRAFLAKEKPNFTGR